MALTSTDLGLFHDELDSIRDNINKYANDNDLSKNVRLLLSHAVIKMDQALTELEDKAEALKELEDATDDDE